MSAPKPKLDRVLAELAKRDSKKLRLEDHLFPQQLAVANDPRSFKTVVCSRRAGKSTYVSGDLVQTANLFPGVTALYVTGTRVDAKKIIWSEIKKFNRDYRLGGTPNESELTLSFPNNSIVRLAGAKDEADIDKIRGQLPPVKKVFIDEAQSIRDRVLVKLVDDILEPALLDYAGSLTMLGTPGPVPVGYFHAAAHNPEWSHHGWTFFQNPFIPLKSGLSHQESLQRVLSRRGVTIDDPSIQREFFGRWVQDTNSLVVRYAAATNSEVPPPILQHFVIGVDLGFDDADAIAVVGWNDSSPKAYLVKEELNRGQGITELANQIARLIDLYRPVKVVMDTGGLGKKIAEELRRRYALPIVAAEKSRKFEFIELMNDALRIGRLHATTASHFARDSQLLEWDRDRSKGDRKVVSERFHSDIIDAVLYAYREALHWLHIPEETPVAKGSDAYFQKIVDQMEAQALAQLQPPDTHPADTGFASFGDDPWK